MAELARRIITNPRGHNFLSKLFSGVKAFGAGIDQEIELKACEAERTNTALCLLFGGETTVEVKGSGKGK